MRITRRSAVGLLGLASASLLGGCSGPDAAPTAAGGTVTVTESPAAEPAPEQSPEPVAETPVEGDVTDREHDAGAVVDVSGVAGQQVLMLDRWTVVGLDDGDLAADGAPVVAHTDERFSNQNDSLTYEVPVSPEVDVVLNECIPPADPGVPPGLMSSRGDLAELLARPDLDRTALLMTYDQGQLVQIDTDARC